MVAHDSLFGHLYYCSYQFILEKHLGMTELGTKDCMKWGDNACILQDNEYVMVQLSQTPHVSYRDAQDVKQTDDFDITLIVWHDGTMSECSTTLHLNYYIILTSRRELYPKHEIERKLGKDFS